jgi:membrane-associated protein
MLTSVLAGAIPGLDPNQLITAFGPYALLGVAAIIFAETGLLIGFLLPGDTLLILSGVLAIEGSTGKNAFGTSVWIVAIAIGLAAFLGGEVGYFIGHKFGPRIFERKESGFFSKKNVDRTNAFFIRFGGLAVILARFVPVVRTFAPIAAGVSHMPWKRYSLYNLIGALVWGVGLTMFGYGIGHIPGVAEFVEKYIEFVLIGVVLVILIPTLYHYIQSVMKARRLAKTKHGSDELPTDADVMLPPDVFDPKHHGEHNPKADS